jgi:hypothetical protein
MKLNKRNFIDTTKIINDFIDKKIDILEFNKLYKNFYYYNSLDGHEFSIPENFTEIISLHKKIQNLLDSIYWEIEKNQQFEGRISPTEAEIRLRSMLSNINLKKIMNSI